MYNLCQTHGEGFNDAWLDTTCSSDCDNPQVFSTTDSIHTTTRGKMFAKH